MDNNRPMTKKELKAARRAEKFEYSKMEKSGNNIKWLIIGLVSVVFLGFFGFLIFLAKENNPTTSTTTLEISEDGWIKGSGSSATDSANLSENATVTLVEFGDLQCPACRAYHPVLTQLLESYEPGELRLIFKHYPLTAPHPNAMAAAIAAEAAGNQGQFFPYHDILYDMQDNWAGLTAIDADAKFIEYAERLDLDIDRFNEDRQNPETDAKVRANIDEGLSLGTTGTPTFFLNGKRIANPASLEAFRSLVDEELK